MSPSEFVDVWHGYFDLSRDYGLFSELSENDPVMERAIAFAPGIRS